jgi:hypothetical protein
MKIFPLLLVSSLLLTPTITQASSLNITNKASTTQTINIPKQGNSMKQVRKHYGKAKRISRSKGRVTKKWPRITRWEYGRFTVYFEHRTVLHTVIH